MISLQLSHLTQRPSGILTFFAGVYGMNFEYLPEFKWRWGYPMFWAISLATAGTMLAWFRRKGWL